MAYTPKQVEEMVREDANASSSLRMLIAARTADDVCYYQGQQFLGYSNGRVPWMSSDGVLRTSYNPDASKLRVTQNETTKHLIASFTATDPESIEAQVYPPPANAGVQESVLAQIKEYALNAVLRDTRFINRAKYANFMRCVIGAYGVGWRVAVTKKGITLYGQDVVVRDAAISAFAFHPVRLILDPFNTSTDLRDHERVIYEDVWPITMLRRFFPDTTFDETEMGVVGELASNEVTANARTNGAVFQQYAYYSRTKGARVYQVHIKDESGRFSQMWCGFCYGRDSEIQWINADNPQTPFGGNGLPLGMLYGQPRPESGVGISDVGMVRNDQDLLNLASTWEHRIMQKHAGYQWLVDKRWFGNRVSDDDVTSKFTNQVAGVVTGEPRSNDKSVQPPQLMQTPHPAPTFREMQDRYDMKMGEKVFRTQESRGIGAKSHVPDAAYERLLAEGDRVANVRVAADIETYKNLAYVALGTIIRGVRDQNPSTLAMLVRDGLSPDELVALSAADPLYPACEIVIPLSSVRRRSTVEKKQALDSALRGQAITPEKYRRALADLDIAVDEEDAHMQTVLSKAVADIAGGLEWEPRPLGEYNQWFLSQLTRAQWDRSVVRNPDAIARISRAYMSQKKFALQEMAAEQIAQNPPPPAEPVAQPAVREQPRPENIAQLVEMLAG